MERWPQSIHFAEMRALIDELGASAASLPGSPSSPGSGIGCLFGSTGMGLGVAIVVVVLLLHACGVLQAGTCRLRR